MLSKTYKDALIKTRESNPGWGSSAVRNAGCEVLRLLTRRKDITSVLDFGAGTGTLGRFVASSLDRELEWVNYDPSVPEIDQLPDRQFDLIVTTDLLEHIEPDQLDRTLDWMRSHASRTMFHFIDCNETKDRLPDGRDVHLIVRQPSWWRNELEKGWHVMLHQESKRLKRGRVRSDCLFILDRGVA